MQGRDYKMNDEHDKLQLHTHVNADMSQHFEKCIASLQIAMYLPFTHKAARMLLITPVYQNIYIT